MFEHEAVCVTVATSAGGSPGAVLRAQVWNEDGEDRYEVRYEKEGEAFVLSGHQAHVFLTLVARDASVLLAAPPEAFDDQAQPYRPAGF